MVNAMRASLAIVCSSGDAENAGSEIRGAENAGFGQWRTNSEWMASSERTRNAGGM